MRRNDSGGASCAGFLAQVTGGSSWLRRGPAAAIVVWPAKITPRHRAVGARSHVGSTRDSSASGENSERTGSPSRPRSACWQSCSRQAARPLGDSRPATAATVYARAVAVGIDSDRADAVRLLRAGGVDVIDADARTLSPRLVNRYLELKRRAAL